MKVLSAYGAWSIVAAWFAGAFGLVGERAGAAARTMPPEPAVQQRPQDASAPQDLERLRAMLSQPGPDGREARETAVERLLGSPDPNAHRLLQEQLRRSEDPDHVRETILRALQRLLLGNSPGWFGGAGEEKRRQIFAGYLAALAPLWKEPGLAIDDVTSDPVRAAARLCLQRVPARELDLAARQILAGDDPESKVRVLRCLADMQQVLFAQTMADCLEGPDEELRVQARRSLQLLTYHEEEFLTKAQFLAWFERYGSARYVDLAERAARLGPRPMERMREELARLRVDAAREFVRAHIVPTPGIDWAAIQSRTMVDDPTVQDACLELLQQALVASPPTDDQVGPRQAFCRALLQRLRQVSPEQDRRRSLLLEVAAYLARAEEDVAAEISTLLLTQLDSSNIDVQVAALRGLRRFPNAETRLRLVRYATALLPRGAAVRPQLLAALATMSSRSVPRWCAPASTDPDRVEWLELVAAVCRIESDNEVRNAGLALAQTLDSREQRVPEVFALLLDLAKDPRQDPKFRSACLIHLQGWRSQESAAEGWLRAMHDLLQDPAADLRQQAAESLARLPQSVDARRNDWLGATITVLRDRLLVEPSPTVLRALVDALVACGREPQMPDKAIGALNQVLTEIRARQSAEQQFRLEPLLQALATTAADPHADRGQWIGACGPLLAYEKRQSLRLVLQSHGAVDLAKDVGSPDAGLAVRARSAMQVLIRAALLKPAKDAWTSTEELQREARDVRVAFGALDTVEEDQRLDETVHRILRLEVELAGGKFLEVVQRASGWLANGNGPGGRSSMAPDERDRMRMLLAEGNLALGKADAAARALAELATATPGPQVLDLQWRVARAWFATDPGGAVALLATVWKATPPDDPTFRQRLLDWMQHRIRLEPGSRQATLQEAERFATSFASADCPAELRDAFELLRRPQ